MAVIDMQLENPDIIYFVPDAVWSKKAGGRQK